jgi:hypothetical protein
MKIEKGIPLKKKTGAGVQYPWNEMEVGDSFFVDNCTMEQRSSIQTSGRRYLKYNGVVNLNISTRSEGNGFRFWLVERK